MILIEKVNIVGLEETIRGMRNPMNSWDKSDSELRLEVDDYVLLGVNGEKGYYDIPHFKVGDKDRELMMSLAKGGPVHAKYRRMIVVYLDIAAPLYWWKEFDTYKVGTVANSCSTMHKIHAKEFVMDDFSHDHLIGDGFDGLTDSVFTPVEECDGEEKFWSPINVLELTIKALNQNRRMFLETNDKKYWWQMIQLLPSSYNQKRTIMLNYEVLYNIYQHRKGHKLDEWREFCKWIERLQHSEIIVGTTEEK